MKENSFVWRCTDALHILPEATSTLKQFHLWQTICGFWPHVWFFLLVWECRALLEVDTWFFTVNWHDLQFYVLKCPKGPIPQRFGLQTNERGSTYSTFYIISFGPNSFVLFLTDFLYPNSLRSWHSGMWRHNFRRRAGANMSLEA